MTLALTAARLPSTGPTSGLAQTLVVLASLGTAADPLWGAAARALPADVRVVAIDLPGHGRSRSPWEAPGAATTVAELADAVLEAIDSTLDVERFAVAGDSIGGAIALQLALDYPERITRAGVLCSGAQLGDPGAWEERAELVESAGTPTQIIGSAQRWFAPGFIASHPETTAALLHSLQNADRFAYAALCRALAEFDLRGRLDDVAVPVLAVAGAQDQPAPPENLSLIADGVQDGTFVELPDVAHLAPAEAPARVAQLLCEFVLEGDARAGEPAGGGAESGAATAIPLAGAPAAPDRSGGQGGDPNGEPGAGGQPARTSAGLANLTREQVREEGMRVRREVLSDAHVERAEAAADDFTRDFQDLISRYAWGEIWTRPGLDRRMRSAVTLTAMVAGSHHDELAMHVRAALRNGLTRDEIKEILLQCAIYCSVPSANTAFAIASRVLAEGDAHEGRGSQPGPADPPRPASEAGPHRG